MLKVHELRCEYQRAPVGLDDASPRFSWQLLSDKQNVIQKSYQIQVSDTDRFDSILWESGTVSSDQSVHVAYAGPALHARSRYYYRVKVSDTLGATSAWSQPAFWETGMLHPAEWKAHWITCESEEEEKLEASPLLRTTFYLDKPVTSARAYVTALGLYILYINGIRVGNDYFTPGWTSYHHRIQYQTYDVTDLLHPGANVVGAMLGNGWYAGYIAWERGKGFYGNKRAVLLQLHIRYADGTETVVISDDTWKTTYGPVRMAEIYHGETYDATKEIDGWCSKEFDPKDWLSAEILNHPTNILIAQENELPGIIEEIQPVRLLVTPAGETVLDFGQNMVGFVRFSVQGPRGSTVKLRHAEVLDRDGNFYTANLKGARQTVVYTLKGTGKEVYQPHFTFHGFRYVCVDQYPGEVRLENFTGCVIHSRIEQTGTFTCSNELVNQLQHNILWGQKSNFVDVPTDCPQRDERHGWTGDAQMFIRTACFNMNTALFFSKWLGDLAVDQSDERGVPYVIPDVRDAASASSAAWGDAATICPWTIYLCYGDLRVLEAQYTSMKRWVEYIRRQGDNPYLWNTGTHFGDWLALDNGPGAWIGRTSSEYIATAFYAYSTKLLIRAATVLGYQQDAEAYRDLYGHIVQNFRDEFVTPSGHLAIETQTAYALALIFDLLEERDRKQAADTLANLIRKNQHHLDTGFVGTPYLCHVLSGNGHLDLAYELLLRTDYPSWLYQVTKGATTIWEHWDGIRPDGSFWDEAMNSFNHYSYGSIGDWLYRVVAGLDVDADLPGYKHIILRPNPGRQIQWAKLQYKSLYGVIKISWESKQDELILEITVPANTYATVTLPHAELEHILSDSRNDEALTFVTRPVQVEDGVRLEIGSGSYHFAYHWEA